jgi:hypothetical protein
MFYVAASQKSAIDSLEAAFSHCHGASCGAGGSCGLGGLPPACIDGVCTGSSR